MVFRSTQAFRRVCISREYKCVVGYSVVYHSKATDSARLAEIVGLPKKFEKYEFSRLPKATEDAVFAELVGFPKMLFFGSKSIFRTSRISEDIRPHILPELDLRNIGFPKIFDTVRFICRISRISEDCLLWEYSIFPNYSDFRIGYRRCSLCRISRISEDCLLRQCSIFHICRISEDILHML